VNVNHIGDIGLFIYMFLIYSKSLQVGEYADG